MLKWDNRYNLGDEKIDAEHHIFLNLVADFQTAAYQDAPEEKLLRIVQEIIKYAEFHFLSEENVMLDHDYPDLQHHAGLHRQLLSELKDYYIKLQSQQTSPADIYDFLFQWFAFHTSTEDKKLVGFLNQ